MAWILGLGEGVAEEEEELVVLEVAGSVIASLWVTNVAGDDQRSSLKGSKDLIDFVS